MAVSAEKRIRECLNTRQSPAAIEPCVVDRPVSGLMSGIASPAAFPRSERSGCWPADSSTVAGAVTELPRAAHRLPVSKRRYDDCSPVKVEYEDTRMPDGEQTNSVVCQVVTNPCPQRFVVASARFQVCNQEFVRLYIVGLYLPPI